MRTKANRILTCLIGLVLLALGLAVVIGSADLQRHWDFTLPSSWPFDGPHDVLLSNHDRTRYRSDGWWWPVVIAALAVILAGSVWWLLAQAFTGRLRQFRVDSGDGQGALIRGRAMEDVLSAESQTGEGVEWARTRLFSRRGDPQVRMVLGLAPHATPREVLKGIDTELLADARSSTGLDSLPAEALLRPVQHRATRVD